MPSWTPHTSPFDSPTNVGRICWSPDVNLYVAVGCSGDGSEQIMTSPDGIVWTGQGNPWSSSGQGNDVCWSSALMLFIAVGANFTDLSTTVVTSPDGFTWTPQASPADTTTTIWGVAVDDSGLIIAVGNMNATNDFMMSSPDGSTWTTLPSPMSGDGGQLNGVCWSPDLTLWCVGGQDGATGKLFMTSPDGTTWTQQTSPIDNAPDTGGATVNLIEWSTTFGVFLAAVFPYTFSVDVLFTSPDGVTWTGVATPINTAFSEALAGVDAGGTIILGGQDASGSGPTIVRSDDLSGWSADTSPYDAGGVVTGLAYSPALVSSVAIGFMTTGGVVSTSVPAPPPPPVQSFYQAPPWRFVITNLDGAVVTFLDRLAMNRTVTLTLNAPAKATADVPSDNPEVNIQTDSDGVLIPFVSMGDKLLFAFRRENPDGGPVWAIRYAGPLQQINDEIESTTDVPTSHLTSFDPWAILQTIPVLKSDGSLPGSSGLSYNGSTPLTIILALLNNAKIGIQNIIDEFSIAGVALSAQEMFLNWGQTPFLGTGYGSGPNPFFTGTLEEGAAIDSINFAQGISVGDALTQLTNGGYIDIVLTPIWDQVNQPGVCCQLNTFALAGQKRYVAQFSWDFPGRSLIGINRLEDGSQLANIGVGYAGQGGPPVLPPAVLKTSVKRYGPYWLQSKYTQELASDAVVATLMAAQVALLAAGQSTITIDVAPETAPRPFLDYNLADMVPVFVSSNFRQELVPTLVDGEWTNFQRIYEIPFVILDDGPETVQQLKLTGPQLTDS